MMKKNLKIEGMMCAHCQKNVEKTLLAIDGVEETVVDLDKNQATVSLTKDIPEGVFRDAIEGAGYTLISCEAV